MKRTMLSFLALAWLATACATPATAPSGSNGASVAAGGGPSPTGRTLVAAVQSEPRTVAARIIAQGAVSLSLARRIFNADLALLDDQSNPLPYLAETLPQLDTNDWVVNPDGTMVTTYHLKPNLVWHDGSPLTADSFVFSYQVYSTPALGQGTSLPIKLIDRVEAADDRTVVIYWNAPYAAAGALQSLGSSAVLGLPPLPRWILASSLEAGPEAFINNPYWTTGYIGLGPYKLDRWVPGAFLEASAFEHHALGVAKIPRIKIMFVGDGDAALASILSGDIQAAGDQAISLSQAVDLMRQLPAGQGAVVQYFNQWMSAHFQGRADFVSPAALRDVRVRQALAFAVDRPTLNEAIFAGQNLIADSMFAPTSDLGRAANTVAVTYPYDLGRSAALMAEAGFTKGPGGSYVGADGVVFAPELRGSAGSDSDRLTDAVASGWHAAGFAVTETIVPSTQAQDLQVKSSYPGIAIQNGSGGEGAISSLGSDSIPRPENGWRGSGIGFAGYSNPDIDRLVTAFGAALEPADRIRAAQDIVRRYTSDEPSISLFFPPTPWIFTSQVQGPMLRPASSNVSWNIYDWELR